MNATSTDALVAGCRGDGGARRVPWPARRRPGRGLRRRPGRRLPPAHHHPQGSVMPAITTNDLKNGMTLAARQRAVHRRRVPARQAGQGRRLRAHHAASNARTGAVIDRTFRAAERVEQAILDKRDMQFLYRDGDDYVFMDTPDLRPDQRAAVGARRGGRLPRRAGHGQPGHVRRRDRVGRDPRLGRARRSPRPSPACRATGCRAPASRPRSRRARSSRCRCS